MYSVQHLLAILRLSNFDTKIPWVFRYDFLQFLNKMAPPWAAAETTFSKAINSLRLATDFAMLTNLCTTYAE